MSDTNCVFCKIVAGQLPSSKVFENEEVLAFKDIQPAYSTHYLFVPKKHYSRLDEIPNNEISIMSKLYEAINFVAHKEQISAKGFKTQIHVGQGGGQVVFHLHIHLMAGSKLK